MAAVTAGESIETFLAALASAEPTPGGGSAAALAGALGAGLAAMVGRVTAKHLPPASEPAALAAAADRLCERLADLAAADGRAYAAVIAARRRPAPEREVALAAALRSATEVPLGLVAASRDVLCLCDRIAGAARASTLADLGVAAILAAGALRAGTLTARANLADIADAAYVRETRGQLDALIAEGRAVSLRVERTLAGRGTPTA